MTDQHGENPAEPTPGTPPSEGAATPPPPPPAAPSAPGAPAASSGPQFDINDAKATLESANKLDLGIVAAGVVALIGSWLPFYTISVKVAGFGGGSGSVSAWHGFFGWFAVLVALATSVAVALVLFKVVQLPAPVHLIAVAGFGLAFLLLLLTLFVDPSGGCNGIGSLGVKCDIGRGFGYWLALLAVLAGGGLAFMRMRESTTTAHAA
jgi:hypothetical protein